MKLARNFSLKEMTASQTADRLGLKNEPDKQQLVIFDYFVTAFFNLFVITTRK